jgi:hypothetical protein
VLRSSKRDAENEVPRDVSLFSPITNTKNKNKKKRCPFF